MSAAEEEEFEREYGVPVNAGGSVVVARWGTALVMLFVAIALSALLLAYFYLRLENPQWPPPGVAVPSLWPALLAGLLLAASAVAVAAAQRRIAAGDRRRFLLGLAGGLALALGGALVQWGDIARLDIHGTVHAYGSIFHTLSGFVSVVAVAAMIMLAMTIYWGLRGTYSPRRHAPVANVVRFWLAMVAVWITGYATLYLGPHLT